MVSVRAGVINCRCLQGFPARCTHMVYACVCLNVFVRMGSFPETDMVFIPDEHHA
jgi:hypothetical protein